MTNPFTNYTPPHRKPMRERIVRSDADAPMKPSALEKKQRDVSAQMRLYREHHREELDVARHGEWGAQITALEQFIRKMTIDDGLKLVEKAKALAKADVFTRRVALRLCGDACERMRVVNGLAPFDDSMPFSDEQPTVFEQCHEVLT